MRRLFLLSFIPSPAESFLLGKWKFLSHYEMMMMRCWGIVIPIEHLSSQIEVMCGRMKRGFGKQMISVDCYLWHSEREFQFNAMMSLMDNGKDEVKDSSQVFFVTLLLQHFEMNHLLLLFYHISQLSLHQTFCFYFFFSSRFVSVRFISAVCLFIRLLTLITYHLVAHIFFRFLINSVHTSVKKSHHPKRGGGGRGWNEKEF